MNFKITLLPGDGIGPEVVGEAVRVLEVIASKYNHTFSFQERLMGGCSIDKYGSSLTDEALADCQSSDAVAGEEGNVEIQFIFLFMSLRGRFCFCPKQSPVNVGDCFVGLRPPRNDIILLMRHHQAIFHRVRQRAPTRFDDIRARTDCAPARRGIARVDQYTGDRFGAMIRIQNADLVIRQMKIRNLRIITDQRFAQRIIHRIDRTIAFRSRMQ